MLFLAVFCGFLAENFREHQIEHKREKVYITSLIKDMELDTASLRLTYRVRKQYITYFDSLVLLLRQNDKTKLNDMYFYARFLGRINEFKYHDRTIQQLKSSGSLRLIRNKEAADSITIYDNEAVKLVLNQQEIERNLTLLNSNPADLKQFYNDVAMKEYTMKVYNAFLRWAREAAIKLMQEIKNEYHFK